MSEAMTVVGIDVGSRHLDVACLGAMLPERLARVANDRKGHVLLIKALLKLRPVLVLMEATGGYEKAIADALQGAGLKVSVSNPGEARNFARSMRRHAKTDQLDAQMLAEYAEALARRPDVGRFLRPAPDPVRERLRSLAKRRRQLNGMLHAEEHRRLLADASVRDSHDAVIRCLREQISQIRAELEVQVRTHYRAEDEVLKRVAGVGPVISMTLVAAMPELGRLNRRQTSSLAGVVPFARDSGRRNGKRRIFGGRSDVRWALYMATVTAVRCNAVIRPFYERLLTKGKPKKAAMIACCRKLLIYLNCLARDHWPKPQGCLG